MNRPLKYFANGRDLCLIGDNLSATKKLTRRSFLIGDVTAARISVENGAFFKGGIDIKKVEAKAAPEVKPAVEGKTFGAATASASPESSKSA